MTTSGTRHEFTARDVAVLLAALEQHLARRGVGAAVFLVGGAAIAAARVRDDHPGDRAGSAGGGSRDRTGRLSSRTVWRPRSSAWCSAGCSRGPMSPVLSRPPREELLLLVRGTGRGLDTEDLLAVGAAQR